MFQATKNLTDEDRQEKHIAFSDEQSIKENHKEIIIETKYGFQKLAKIENEGKKNLDIMLNIDVTSLGKSEKAKNIE